MKRMFFYFLKIINYLNLKKNKINFSNVKIKGLLRVVNKGEFYIGENTIINTSTLANPTGLSNSTTIIVYKNAKLNIGNNVGISNSKIICKENICIEDYVYIGTDCKIYDTDFHSLYLSERKSNPEIGIKNKSIRLKKGCFLGSGTIVLKGVTIGQCSVVGAGSVVTKNIPDFEVWAGNPARFIKKIERE